MVNVKYLKQDMKKIQENKMIMIQHVMRMKRKLKCINNSDNSDNHRNKNKNKNENKNIEKSKRKRKQALSNLQQIFISSSHILSIVVSI